MHPNKSSSSSIVAGLALVLFFSSLLLITNIIHSMPPSAEAFVASPLAPVAVRPSGSVPALFQIGRRSDTTASNLPFPTKRSMIRPPPGVSCPGCFPADLMLCRAAVSDLSEDASSFNENSASDTTPIPGTPQQKRVFSVNDLKDRLLKASNFASMLCVLDCTILPLITVVLPLFGIVAASPAQMEWLHELGHSLALWFVLPVGGLATTLNFTNHRVKWIAALGYLGLTAVVAANAGCGASHAVTTIVPGAIGHFLHHVLHTVHHGIWHRVTNLAGCAFLLTSNYLSHKQGACAAPACTHDHSHEHNHHKQD